MLCFMGQGMELVAVDESEKQQQARLVNGYVKSGKDRVRSGTGQKDGVTKRKRF